MSEPDFDADVALELLEPGRYRAHIHQRWWIVAGPNGGLLIAQLAHAMQQELDDPHRQLRTITVHYLRPPAEGEVEIAVDVVRVGRSLATLRATMSQDGKAIATGLAAFSPAWDTSHAFSDRPLPEVATVDQLERPPLPDFVPPLQQNYDVFPVALPSAGEGQPVVRAWIRTQRPRTVDTLALVAIADALPPPLFLKVQRPMGVPTIELTVHIRASLPHAGLAPEAHVLMDARSTHLADGFVEEDTCIWAPDGTLLAQSRQLALAR